VCIAVVAAWHHFDVEQNPDPQQCEKPGTDLGGSATPLFSLSEP
jgi:hypothetical protein